MHLQRSRPQRVFDYFRIRKRGQDLTVPIVNHMKTFISQVYCPKTPEHQQTVLLYYWCAMHSCMILVLCGPAREQERARQNSVVPVYVVTVTFLPHDRCLEFLMESLHPTTVHQRRHLPQVIEISDKDRAHEKLTLVDLHAALLSISLEVVAAVQREGNHDQGTLFAVVQKAGMHVNTLSCWDATCWMLACFSKDEAHAAPPGVMVGRQFQHLHMCQNITLASLSDYRL